MMLATTEISCPRSSSSARSAWSSFLTNLNFSEHFEDAENKYTKGKEDVLSLFMQLLGMQIGLVMSVGLRNSYAEFLKATNQEGVLWGYFFGG